MFSLAVAEAKHGRQWGEGRRLHGRLIRLYHYTDLTGFGLFHGTPICYMLYLTGWIYLRSLKATPTACTSFHKESLVPTPCIIVNSLETNLYTI